MSTPALDTPWVPTYPGPLASVIDPPVDGYWAEGDSGRVVWIPTPATPPGLATPDTNWHNIGDPGEIAFVSGWGPWPDTSYTPVRYRKMADGLVILDGLIYGGAAGSDAFYLPVGWRPLGQDGSGSNRIKHFVLPGSAPIPWGSCWLYSDSGAVQISVDGISNWVSLNNIRFYAGL